MILRRVPASPASTTLAIFSVSTSRSPSPTSTLAPGFTTQPVPLPADMESPHFGITIGLMRLSAMLPLRLTKPCVGCRPPLPSPGSCARPPQSPHHLGHRDPRAPVRTAPAYA